MRTRESQAGSTLSEPHRDSSSRPREKTTEALIEYARVGVGRPPGALTPDEARDIVTLLTRSEALGDRAAELVGRCDLALFAAGMHLCDAKELIDSARELFEALGQVSTAEAKSDLSAPPDRANA